MSASDGMDCPVDLLIESFASRETLLSIPIGHVDTLSILLFKISHWLRFL